MRGLQISPKAFVHGHSCGEDLPYCTQRKANQKTPDRIMLSDGRQFNFFLDYGKMQKKKRIGKDLDFQQ